MADKLKMAHERRKLNLRGRRLQNRARIAQLQEDNRRIQDELRAMAPSRRTSTGSLPPLPRVKL